MIIMFQDRVVIGNSMFLFLILLVVDVYVVEMRKNKGGKVVRVVGICMCVLRKYS